jgi:hypothetical protein
MPSRPRNPLRRILGKRLFLSRRVPDFKRILVVESGSRTLLDNLLPGLNDLYGGQLAADLVTCYAGEPQGFLPERGRVYRVTDCPDATSRARLYRELKSNGYQILGIICSGEAVMTKWKWMLVYQVPAKVFVLNENGDYFWVDYTNWRTILHFFAFRAGLTGTGAVMTPLRLLMLPLSFLYLLLWAGWAHFKRKKITV